MKTTIKLLAIMIAAFSVSCENFLEQDLKSNIDATEFFKDGKDAKAAVDGAYGALAMATNWGIYDANMAMADLGTLSQSSNTSSSRYTDFVNYAISYDNETITALYANQYNVIQKVNYAIEGIEGMADYNQKNRFLAELKFIRALVYFNLVRHFGGVPIKTTATENMDSPGYARHSVQEVYQQIIRDLEFCQTNLWYKATSSLTPRYTSEDVGRATRCAAMGLLSKVYLTAASYAKHSLVDKADENYSPMLLNSYSWVDIADYYTRSAAMAQMLINLSESGQVDVRLNDNYGTIFTQSGENSSESLFEIQYIDMSGFGGRFGCWMAISGLPNTYKLRIKGTAEILFMYERKYDLTNDAIDYANTDLRGLWNFSMVSYNESTGAAVNIKKFNEICYSKYRYGRLFTLQDNVGTNFPVLRYADVVLGYAEALNELGQSDKAVEYLNKIRERARKGNQFAATYSAPFTFEYTGTSNVPANLPTMTYEQTRDAIIKERHLELCGEGNSRFDAVRMGRLLSEIRSTHVYEDYADQGTTSDNIFKLIEINGLPQHTEETLASKNIKAFHQFFPIPKDEIERTPSSILKQNPGW